MQANILIIEDDPDIVLFLKEILNQEGYQTHSSATGIKGLEMASELNPDLLLLDLTLPDLEGEFICRKLKKNNPEIKIIMLTAKGTPEDLARGLGLGADDYVAKPIVLPELLARIKARLRADSEENQVITLGELQLNLRTHEVNRDGKNIELSAQEFKLLHYLMSNPNRVLTRDVILSRIWGVSADVETRVVDVYVGYLRKKIDSGSKVKYIQSVRGFGYMLKIS